MKRADRSGARFALILGDDELARGVVAIKALRGEGAQHEVPLDGVAAELGRRLGRGTGIAIDINRERLALADPGVWYVEDL